MRGHTLMQRLRWKILGVMAMAVLLMLSFTSIGMAGSTGDFVDDSVITTKVKSSFVADSTVSALDISVETTQGVVNLTESSITSRSGSVQSRSLRRPMASKRSTHAIYS